MPHDQCPPSQRGHSWRELAQADLPSRTVAELLNPTLRLCKRCGALGRVSKQGVIHVVEAP